MITLNDSSGRLLCYFLFISVNIHGAFHIHFHTTSPAPHQSVFSSLKSYFGSRGGSAAEPSGAEPALPQSASESQLQQTVRRSEQAAADRPAQPHPGLRVRGLEDGPEISGGTAGATDPYASVDARLDRNLGKWCFACV